MFIEKISNNVELMRGIWHFASVFSSAVILYFASPFGLWLFMAFGAIFAVFDFGRSRGVRWMNWVIRRLTGEFFFRALRKKEITHVSTSCHFIIAGIVIILSHLYLGLPLEAILPAAIFMAVGDPMARLIGMEWKRNGFNGLVAPELRKKCLFGKKTLIGSASFFGFGLAAAFLFCAVAKLNVAPFVLVIGALVATIVELWSTNWDNFTVPISSIAVMWALVQI